MWGYFEYVPVSEKKEKARKQIEKLRKKDPDISPVVIEGNKIAKTWWAIAWNKNLESYADYSNRIQRGRSYVKNGFVIDLRIKTCEVTALVQGTSSKPYKITIKFKPISKTKWENVISTCSNKIDGIEELVQGKFPKALEDVFTSHESGLFPSPKEIEFDCSCPDWASMCKHVAAVLYGIGARFDEDPTLFFLLRDIDFQVLLKKSVEDKMKSMLLNADKKSERVLDNVNISDLFNI